MQNGTEQSDMAGSNTTAASNPARTPRRTRPLKPPEEISAEEIEAAINAEQFPAILTIQQAAAMLQLSTHTLYKAVSEGKYRNAVRRRKPLRFWRNRLIQSYFAS